MTNGRIFTVWELDPDSDSVCFNTLRCSLFHTLLLIVLNKLLEIKSTIPCFVTYERRRHDVAHEGKAEACSSKSVQSIELRSMVQNKPDVEYSRVIRRNRSKGYAGAGVTLVTTVKAGCAFRMYLELQPRLLRSSTARSSSLPTARKLSTIQLSHPQKSAWKAVSYPKCTVPNSW